MKKLNIITSSLIGFSVASSFGDEITGFTPDEIKGIVDHIRETVLDASGLNQYLLWCFNGKYGETYQDYNEVLGSDIAKKIYHLKCFEEVINGICTQIKAAEEFIDTTQKEINKAENSLKTMIDSKYWAAETDRDPAKVLNNALNALNNALNALMDTKAKDMDNQLKKQAKAGVMVNQMEKQARLYYHFEWRRSNLLSALEKIGTKIKEYGKTLETFCQKNFLDFYNKMVGLIENCFEAKEEKLLLMLIGSLHAEISDMELQFLKEGLPSLDNLKFIVLEQANKLKIANRKEINQYPGRIFFGNYMMLLMSQVYAQDAIAGQNISNMEAMKNTLKEVDGKFPNLNLQQLQYNLTNHIKNARKRENKPVVTEKPEVKKRIEFAKNRINRDDILNIKIERKSGSHFAGTVTTKKGKTENFVACRPHGGDTQNNKKDDSNVSIVKINLLQNSENGK